MLSLTHDLQPARFCVGTIRRRTVRHALAAMKSCASSERPSSPELLDAASMAIPSNVSSQTREVQCIGRKERWTSFIAVPPFASFSRMKIV